MAVAAEQRPIRLIVRDDLQRSRLTVVFRLFLAIPLFVWVVLRGIAAGVVGFVNWLAVLIQGEVPDSLHGFVASYIRYSTQVSAYVFLAADPYPWFRCQSDYPIDLEIDGADLRGARARDASFDGAQGRPAALHHRTGHARVRRLDRA